MKKLIALTLVATVLSSHAFADEYVHGYTRQDGTQVQGYERTDRNNTVNDNYSTEGNTNPYTGKEGTKARQDN